MHTRTALTQYSPLLHALAPCSHIATHLPCVHVACESLPHAVQPHYTHARVPMHLPGLSADPPVALPLRHDASTFLSRRLCQSSCARTTIHICRPPVAHARALHACASRSLYTALLAPVLMPVARVPHLPCTGMLATGHCDASVLHSHHQRLHAPRAHTTMRTHPLAIACANPVCTYRDARTSPSCSVCCRTASVPRCIHVHIPTPVPVLLCSHHDTCMSTSCCLHQCSTPASIRPSLTSPVVVSLSTPAHCAPIGQHAFRTRRRRSIALPGCDVCPAQTAQNCTRCGLRLARRSAPRSPTPGDLRRRRLHLDTTICSLIVLYRRI